MQRIVDFISDAPWLATAAIAAIAVFVSLLFHRIASSLLRRHTLHLPLIHAILVGLERPASAVLPLIALQLVWQAAPDNLQHMASVRHVNGVLLIGALTWLGIGAIQGFANGIIARNPLAVQDNLHARRVQTQTMVLARSAMVIAVIAGSAMALMTFPGARQLGASLLASAGVIGIVGGIAARPVFSNLIAGLQLALAQPIRLDDVLIVKGENGRVEEITGTYVVLKLWDERRMIVPLQWFVDNPFENWTRSASQLTQSVNLLLDFTAPLDQLRAELDRLLPTFPEWDQRVGKVDVTDSTDRAMKVRVLVSGRTSSLAFDLGCKVREGLLTFLARNHPYALPRLRMADADASAGEASPAAV